MKISVVVPAYNSERSINRCLDSLLRQRGAEIEIIVINDGSTDNTEQLLIEYGNRIKFRTIENGGVANARNQGLKLAEGDFVMFVDSDDELADRCIEDIVQRQNEKSADIIRFGYLECYQDGRYQLPKHTFEREKLVEKKDFKKEIYPYYINGIMLNSICMTLFKREILLDVEFRIGMTTAEDTVFSMEAYTRADKILIIPKPYYLYNRDSNSLTTNGISIIEKYRCNFILAAKMVKYLPRWGMNTPYWYIKTYLRPIFLTRDKLKRNKELK